MCSIVLQWHCIGEMLGIFSCIMLVRVLQVAVCDKNATFAIMYLMRAMRVSLNDDMPFYFNYF